ncbi:MAG: Crp/Fnr family transcriptional regulator [Proteobacteria bacterium]|nr:Crp/Fnr family transcriptional regulator [Pseudomonadota bacterium]
MQGLTRKIVGDRWDGAFVARLRRYIEFSASEINDLRGLLEVEHSVRKRRDVVVEGGSHARLSFVKNGVAARYKVLHNGKRQIVNIIVPGDVIGLPGSFLDTTSFAVVALTDMKLEVCALDDYVALAHRRPKFGLALSWLAVHEATTYAEHIVDIGRRTALERVAHFLLEIHDRLAAVGRAAATEFDLPVSQEIMSDALGLSVPHINRMLAELRESGMIALAGRHVSFADIKRLQQLAHFEPVRLTRIPAPSQPSTIIVPKRPVDRTTVDRPAVGRPAVARHVGGRAALAN